jgi:hypothetical protein
MQHCHKHVLPQVEGALQIAPACEFVIVVMFAARRFKFEERLAI